MRKTIAYMITWTTYGTWLQGDERQYVKDSITFLPNEALAKSNRENLQKDPIKLTPVPRQIAQKAIFEKAKQLNQTIHALSVASTHIHILAEYIPMPIGMVVRHYKNYAQVSLRKAGLTGKVWTKGFDKRYCFDQQTLKNRIRYVNLHKRFKTPE